ncbi:hypothetical protein C7M84_016532 [Penaeus vannamei]|uniref:DUF4149 domain-containing protein n=1 Tax=Penaeus vannamei TaxID=6689 RepID=A0A423SMW0_PENVA|nr:hypothetical protein C7M84_016532 [Penaeus vannamei]
MWPRFVAHRGCRVAVKPRVNPLEGSGGILVGSFLVNLGIRLYLAPVLTKLITVKIAIEREAGLGQEIGTNRPGRLAHCPHYMRLYRAFRRTHMIIAIGNMVAMAATSLHLYYLATKLCSVHL